MESFPIVLDLVDGGRGCPGLDAGFFRFQDLNRPSSHSKAEFLDWAAQTGQIRAIFGGV